MIFNSNVSVQSKIQSYLRYGLRIAKKAEINKRLTDQDDYKQKMIEKYLDRAREIRNNGLYQIVRGQGGQKNLLYFEKSTRVVAQDLLKLGFTEKKQDMFPKDRGIFATDKKTGLFGMHEDKAGAIPSVGNTHGKANEKQMNATTNAEKDVAKNGLRSIREKQISRYRFYSDRRKQAERNQYGTESDQDDGTKKKSEIASKQREDRVTSEDLRIKRQKILNEMVQSKGDPNRLHELNLQFSKVDNELRLRHQ